jgi:DNA-binding transcriptional MerR regulator
VRPYAVTDSGKSEQKGEPIAVNKTWKVGELARLTGVTVRTLHHYHEIGLLCPSERSESGYRLYTAHDIARLQQIKSLRHMGFSLEEVRECLGRTGFSLEHVLNIHLERVKEQIALQQQLCERLEAARARINRRQAVSVEEFLKITEAISMSEKYFDAEQRAYLQERENIVGAERIREVEAEWPRLMDDVRAAIQRGDAPESETGQDLAKRWNGLIEEFTGGNEGVRNSLNTMYKNESNVAGMDVQAMQPLWDYIQRASEAGA